MNKKCYKQIAQLLLIVFINTHFLATPITSKQNNNDLTNLLLLKSLSNNPTPTQGSKIKKYDPQHLLSSPDNPLLEINQNNLPLSEIEKYFYDLDQQLSPSRESLFTNSKKLETPTKISRNKLTNSTRQQKKKHRRDLLRSFLSSSSHHFYHHFYHHQ